MQAQARAVFAHFMVSNTLHYTVGDWENEMALAHEAKIDAFALNMAAGETTNGGSVGNAFLAAENYGFQLFFSFDYAGNGPWAESDVISMITTYASELVYFHRNGQPLVSTFEGPGNAADWINIKKQTGCFFIPDWSSVGAQAAAGLANGVADGLFNWAAWPTGNTDMNTYVDASYIDFLEGKPYMMPISPWFFTNMPGFDKNWVWRGDDLWFDRWEQAMYLAPEFIEIISWNDFGESHYIGPIPSSDSSLADSIYTAFDTGQAPYNYVENMPHDGWRAFLPWLIDTYKNNVSNIEQEGVQTWYRLNIIGGCSDDGGTTGNTVSQLQLEYYPYQVLQNKVFFSALLISAADVSVSIGGNNLGGQWDSIPSDGAGIYHGSVTFASEEGPVVVKVTRGGAEVASVTGQSIVFSCATTKAENYNAWVGSAMASTTVDITPKYSLSNEVCVEGWGIGNFDGLCSFTCSLGYCPVGACLCKKMGPQPKLPKSQGVVGYPIASMTGDYIGLCAFACNYGYCPSSACGTTEVPLTVSTVSAFTPDTCTGGEGDGDLAGLCSYACNFGYCPIQNCTCTSTGQLNVPPAADSSLFGFYSGSGSDNGLCDFACERGYCPSPTCIQSTGSSGSDDDEDEDTVCDDDDTRAECADDYSDDTTGCDYSLSFKSFSDLNAASNSYTKFCKNYYSLGVLSEMLDASLANYSSMSGGYDSEFNEYVKYVKEEVPLTLESLMDGGGAGNAFFQCTEGAGIKNISTTTCPYHISLNHDYDANGKIYYDLLNATDWWDTLLSKYGLQKSWVQLGDRVIKNHCGPKLNPDGSVCHEQTWTWVGFPLAADNIVVDNPATLVEKSLPKIHNLIETITMTRILIVTGAWGGAIDDVVVSFSTTVFTLVQAVANMAKIEKTAEKYDSEKKKKLAEEIVMAFLLVVPFIGELDFIVGEMDVLADVITMVSDVGMLADSIYNVVTAKDTGSAILAIFGVLLAGGIPTFREFKEMSGARRAMSDDDISKIGAEWKEADDQMNKLIDVCY
ncbi:uncharacterized protein N7511_004871 [Penicillium nucicola]|uniref:uncharacterized protein n=1 Tax=Penicillium nucicola TaxID=1850975 RepID=UPI00254587CA|nr:uncharacterized protein N7511_004871 [Penicillium nucicola]KAJ5767255.1 hypothetical protein N7511_004871 [Penicillium nucicola]